MDRGSLPQSRKVKTMSLIKRRFREELHPLISWGIALFLSGLVLMAAGSIFMNQKELTEGFSDIIKGLPNMAKNFLGGNLATNFSSMYLTGMAFDSIAPILILIYASLAALGLYTREAGQGNLEFLFSLPIARFKLITQRILVFLLDLAILHLLLALGTILGTAITGIKLDYSALAWALADLFLLNFCVSGLAYLLSLSTSDYSRGILLVLGIMVGLLILNMGLGSESKSVLAHINPYHYYKATDIFYGLAIPWLKMLGFALSGLAFWGVGTWWYMRKQI